MPRFVCLLPGIMLDAHGLSDFLVSELSYAFTSLLLWGLFHLCPHCLSAVAHGAAWGTLKM